MKSTLGKLLSMVFSKLLEGSQQYCVFLAARL